MTQTIINLGTGGAVLNGRNGSTAGADSNDALFLDWPGDNQGNYVYVTGADFNSLRVPDEAALDITGDIDLRVYMAMDDWADGGADRAILSKWGSSNNSYRMDITGSGLLILYWSTTGSNLFLAGSTVSVTANDGAPLWVRATLDVDNGASGRTIRFFTSSDGVTWVQLGADVVQATATSIFSGTSQFVFGAGFNTGGGSAIAAKAYRCQVLNGIGGTTVLDIDTSVITSGSATSFTARTGQTVSILRHTSGRKSVAVVSPVWLFGTDDRFQVTNNALLNFGNGEQLTLIAVVRTWGTRTAFRGYLSKLGSGTVGYALGIPSDANNSYVFVEGPVSTTNTPQVTSAASGGLGVYAGRRTDTQVTIQRGSGSPSAVTSTTTDLSNTQRFEVGTLDQGSTAIDMELIAVAVFRRALSVAEISAVTAYYQARLS